MDATDTSPLISDDVDHVSSEEGEEDVDKRKEAELLKELVFFHGRELASNKSFLHGPKPSAVRIAVGRQGVYKLESKKDKFLVHWKFNDLKDWTYSGYSLTLQFKSGGHYSLRTDDGEGICSYIEAFQKDPTEALRNSISHPPNSRLPDVGSGIRTLRRKFSGESSFPPPEPSVVFYTLGRRPKKNPHDPTTRLSHNIEVDSRLKAGYSQAGQANSPTGPFLHQTRTRSISNPTVPPNGNNISRDQDKVQAREVLAQKIGDLTLSEKRLSNGILATKGEPTKVATTQPRRIGTSPKPKLPPRPRNVVPQSQHLGEGGARAPEATPVSKVAASTEPPKAPSSNQPSHEKQPPNQILAEKSARPREISPSDSDTSGTSNDTTPLLRAGSSASSCGTPFSPTDSEFQYVPLGPGVRQQGVPADAKNRSRSSSSDSSHYDTLEKIQFVIASKRNSLEVDNQKRSGSDSNGGSGEGALKCGSPLKAQVEAPFVPPSISIRRDSQRSSSASSDSVYDHLSPLCQSPETKGERERESPPRAKPQAAKIDLLPSPFNFSSVRRNVSQPALSTPASARGTPSPSLSGTILELSGSEYDEEEEGEYTPTNSGDEQRVKDGQTSGADQLTDLSGVVLRKKKRAPDPFADILGSPSGIARLRWSQELNPLYDYIKGVKVSDSVSQDVRFYDVGKAEGADKTPTPTRHNPPSVIMEESELSEGESIASPNAFSERESSSSARQGVSASYPGLENEPGESPPSGASLTLPKIRRPHTYEDVCLPSNRPMSHFDSAEGGEEGTRRGSLTLTSGKPETPMNPKAMTLASLNVRRLKTWDKPESLLVSPRLGKRELQQRRSRTLACMDDTEALKRKQRPMTMKGPDELKDFSYAMREYRLFFIKMPTGKMHRDVFSINKPVGALREKLCDLLGVDNPDNYLLYVEGSFLTSLKETDITGEVAQTKVSRAGSFTHLSDNLVLPDQGTDPILLKTNLSLRMQGISTSRVLSLMSDDEVTDDSTVYPEELPTNTTSDFHRDWIGLVQGNHPCSQDEAVKLAALQYQAYFLDRTAVHSVVEFCRPTEFLPAEYSCVRGVEQKMYKEQEKLNLKTHKEIQEAYHRLCSTSPTHDTVVFPAREPRKKLLQSTKLKPILLGVNNRGILRIDPKTHQVLDLWEFQVLKNWAYSRKTFVVALTNKKYPVECNQAKWVSELVDFHVDSIINSPTALTQIIPGSESSS